MANVPSDADVFLKRKLLEIPEEYAKRDSVFVCSTDSGLMSSSLNHRVRLNQQASSKTNAMGETKSIQESNGTCTTKLLRYTLPVMGMLLLSSAYGIVDGLFVSNFADKTAFASVTITPHRFESPRVPGHAKGPVAEALLIHVAETGAKRTSPRAYEVKNESA